MLTVVLPPTLGSREHEPASDVGDLPAPTPVQFRRALTAPKALDDPLHLQELAFRVVAIFRSGQSVLGAGAQVLSEIANLGIRVQLSLKDDISSRVVVDAAQGLIDPVDPLPTGLPLTGELGLEVGHLPDRVLVEQRFEPGLESRKVIRSKVRQHHAVLVAAVDRSVRVARLQAIGVDVGSHRIDDSVAKASDLPVFVVDLRLQPIPHVTLTRLAGFDGQSMLSKGL